MGFLDEFKRLAHPYEDEDDEDYEDDFDVSPRPVERRDRDRDGSLNERYCMWCWDGEGFAQDCTLEEMVEHCLPHMQLSGMEPETCRAYLESLLPTLERWREMP